jgi:hypothetical protein
MPPFYDIYGLSERRDIETTEIFLNHFCYRDKVEDRDKHEIGIFKNDKYGVDELIIQIKTLSEVIEYAVNNRKQCFVFYIGDYLKKNIGHIILKFTYDEKVIFGISIEEKILTENGQLVDNYEEALIIEKEISKLTNATKTSIQFEYPPSDTEEEFDSDIELWRSMNDEK